MALQLRNKGGRSRRFTDEQLLDMLALSDKGYSHASIAGEYNVVTRQQVSRYIKHARTIQLKQLQEAHDAQ